MIKLFGPVSGTPCLRKSAGFPYFFHWGRFWPASSEPLCFCKAASVTHSVTCHLSLPSSSVLTPSRCAQRVGPHPPTLPLDFTPFPLVFLSAPSLQGSTQPPAPSPLSHKVLSPYLPYSFFSFYHKPSLSVPLLLSSSDCFCLTPAVTKAQSSPTLPSSVHWELSERGQTIHCSSKHHYSVLGISMVSRLK